MTPELSLSFCLGSNKIANIPAVSQSFKNPLAAMTAPPKRVKELTTEELVGEVTKYRKLMSEMKANMECPVCLIVPRDGPVPCCPRGHLICTNCLDKMLPAVDGKKNCPTCREPMGEGKNLLAKMLIENMEHECDLEGCKQLVPFIDLEQHKKICDYRLVICPGRNVKCKELVPFCSVEKHGCSEITDWSHAQGKIHITFIVPQDRLNLENIVWNGYQLKFKNEVFFLRPRKEADNFIFEVVMKGNQEKCNKFTATIAILDSDLKPSFTGTFNPRPLGTSNDEDSCLSVRQKSLSNIWRLEGDQNRFVVQVVIKPCQIIKITDGA